MSRLNILIHNFFNNVNVSVQQIFTPGEQGWCAGVYYSPADGDKVQTLYLSHPIVDKDVSLRAKSIMISISLIVETAVSIICLYDSQSRDSQGGQMQSLQFRNVANRKLFNK